MPLRLSTAAWLGALAACSGFSQATETPADKPPVVLTLNDIPRAENLLQTREGRIFITGFGALRELVRDPSAPGGWRAQVIPVAGASEGAPSCYYTGVTAYAHTLYTVCVEGVLKTRSFLRALELKLAPAVLKDVAELKFDNGFANGLTVDDSGRLYVAGFDFFAAGAINTISLSAPFVMAEMKTYQRFDKVAPNGLHWHKGRLFASLNPPFLLGESKLVSWATGPEGPHDQKLHYTVWGVIDDFEPVAGGFLTAEFLLGRIRFIDEEGQVRHELKATMPTSVRLMRDEGGANSWMVTTQLGAARATVYQNTWGVTPR
jgi:hypothetical protein